MLRNLFLKRIWDRWPGYIGWFGGLTALTAVTAWFWPTIERDADTFTQLFESLPKGLISLFGSEELSSALTAAGFLNSRIYSGVGALVVSLFAVSMGTQSIAGEEDKRTMDLLLAQPIARSRIVLDGFFAMVIMTTGLVLGIWGVLLMFDPFVDFGLPAQGLIAANVGLILLALTFGSLSLSIGALTGRRSLSFGVGAGTIFATFFINGLAPLISQLAWTQRGTPFYWILVVRPLEHGFGWQFLILVGITIGLVVLAIWGFERRDVSL